MFIYKCKCNTYSALNSTTAECKRKEVEKKASTEEEIQFISLFVHFCMYIIALYVLRLVLIEFLSLFIQTIVRRNLKTEQNRARQTLTFPYACNIHYIIVLILYNLYAYILGIN